MTESLLVESTQTPPLIEVVEIKSILGNSKLITWFSFLFEREVGRKRLYLTCILLNIFLYTKRSMLLLLLGTLNVGLASAQSFCHTTLLHMYRSKVKVFGFFYILG